MSESIGCRGCSWDVCEFEGTEGCGKHGRSPAGFHLRQSGHRLDAPPAGRSWPSAGSRWRLADCGGRCAPPGRCQELLRPVRLLQDAGSMLDRRQRGSSGRGQVLAVGPGGLQCYALRSTMVAESMLSKVC